MNFLKSLGDPLNMFGGGLLWKPIKQATGLTDAQMAGIGAMAVAAPYALPAIAGSGATAGATAGAPAAGSSGGLLSTAGSALGIANQTRGLMQGQQMQAPQMAPAQMNPNAFAGLLSPSMQFDPNKRLQAQQMAVQGLLGSYRG